MNTDWTNAATHPNDSRTVLCLLATGEQVYGWWWPPEGLWYAGGLVKITDAIRVVGWREKG